MHRSIKHISTKGTAMVMFLMLVHLQVRAQFDTLPVTDTTATGYESEEVQIFDRISDSSRVQVRTIPDSMVRHLRSDENYWYVNTTPDRQKQKQVTDVHREKVYEKKWFTQLLWFFLIVSFAVIFVWFLASSNIRLFRRKPKPIVSEEEVITSEDIHSINYENEIEKATAAANYRLAVRLWYLRILKEMADRNIIQYKQDKTNREYVDQLSATMYHGEFVRLTRSFEYIWYGKFDLSAEGFSSLQKDFVYLKERLR